MCLGVGVTQYAGVTAMLLNYADGIFNDGLAIGRFGCWNVLFAANWAAELDAVIALANRPIQQAADEQ
jgi:hypothetical protein